MVSLRRSFIAALIIVTIVTLISLGPYFKVQKISTLVLVPFLFLIAFLFNPSRLSQTISLNKYLLLFLLLCFADVFKEINLDSYMTNLNSLFGAVLVSFIALSLGQKKEYRDFMHIGYILAAISLIIIMRLNGNFNLSNFASVIDYRDRFMLNANAYSYIFFFANTSLFFLHVKYPNNRYVLISLLLLPILFLLTSFITQSRSGLVFLVLINLVYWIFIYQNKTSSLWARRIRKLMIIAALTGFLVVLANVFLNSLVKERFVSSAASEDPRELLLEEGINTFLDHPFTGVGLGQVAHYTSSRQFTHNSFVESASENGIIGFVLILLLLVTPVIKIIRLGPKTINRPNRVCLLFFSTFLLYNNFYPFYKFPFSMLYFFLIVSEFNYHEQES